MKALKLLSLACLLPTSVYAACHSASLLFNAPLTRAANTVSCTTATDTVTGCMSSTDHANFTTDHAAISGGQTGQVLTGNTGGAPTFQGQQSAPSGSIVATAFAACPLGSMAANGGTFSSSTYSVLAAGLGDTYGAHSGTTYHLPDYRGLFLRGLGTSGSYQTANGTYYTGAALGTEQADAMQGHYHSDSGHSHVLTYAVQISSNTTSSTGFVNTPNNNYTSSQQSSSSSIGSSNANVTGPTTDGSNGTPRTTAETRPGNLSVLYCIFY